MQAKDDEMILPRGITGFGGINTNPPLFLDEKAFRRMCHALARENGGAVTEVDTDTAVRNFYSAKLSRYDQSVFLLQNIHYPYVSAKTQKDLLKKLHQNIEEYRDVNLCEDSKMSLREWLDRWLEEYVAPSVRPSTLEGYRGYIQRNIKPHLGDKPVGKITTEDIRKLYRELQAHGRQEEHPQYGYRLAGSTIRRIHGVLHEALDAAVRENMIARNPTEGVTLPKKKAVPKQILNDAQLERFMKVIQEDKIWHDFFYTELTTGLRRGEICGLMWSDFDEAHGTLPELLQAKAAAKYTT